MGESLTLVEQDRLSHYSLFIGKGLYQMLIIEDCCENGLSERHR
jgi:hypothetical protein